MKNIKWLIALGALLGFWADAYSFEEKELLDSKFCEGRTKVKLPKYGNPLWEDYDHFDFKAKSSVYKTKNNQYVIEYMMHLCYEDRCLRGLFEGKGYFFVEWNTIMSEELKETRMLLPNPFMYSIREVANATQDRFLSFVRLQSTFKAGVVWDVDQHSYKLKDDNASTIKIYNQRLEEVAAFRCPAFVIDK